MACSPSSEEPGKAIEYPQPGHNLTPEQLARAYCGSCHQFPEPRLLSKYNWDQNVLKDMGRRLGIISEDYDPFKQISMMDAFVLRSAGIYPRDTLISQKDWQLIVDFYLQEAPSEQPPQADKPPPDPGLKHFKVKVFDDLPAEPLTTLVHFDTLNHLIYWGSRQGDLMQVDAQGKVHRQIELESAPSFIRQQGVMEYVLTMGVMDPSEEKEGTLKVFKHDYQEQVLLSGLQRPVYLSTADLDGDNKEDLIISQFGNQTGKLSWYGLAEGSTYQEHVISDSPGIIKTETGDFDGDGHTDIMALATQGNENISVYYNKGKGRFSQRMLLRFPPVYGSSSFQLVDFDGDGDLDIVYSNGDNADFTFALKNYHGIRIFNNDGDYNFTEAYFYPMYGVMKVTAADFDLDGDLDLMGLSFFPDLDAEEPQGFVYLENEGNFNFRPATFPQAANGRWVVSDTGDFDQDGDVDVVLGSLLFNVRAAPDSLRVRWLQSNYHMILLENTIR